MSGVLLNLFLPLPLLETRSLSEPELTNITRLAAQGAAGISSTHSQGWSWRHMLLHVDYM